MATITYTESPSLDPGWSIRIDTNAKTLQVQELERGSYILATSDTEEFPPGFASCKLAPADEADLTKLLDEANLKIVHADSPDVEGGTFYTLSICRGNTFLGLEWITPPTGSTGLEPLREKFYQLANLCRKG